jgi:hypothetical protein
MASFTLIEFLRGCGLSEDHLTFVQSEMERVKSDHWMAGYMACVRHNKKRKRLIEERTQGSVKMFLDYLHDLTHR